MPYGPYSPVTTPLPSVGGDAQLYSPQQFPFSGPPYYQQLVPPSMPYLTSPTQVSQPELASLVSLDQQGDSMVFGQRPGYPPVGSFGRANFPGSPGGLNFHDAQHGIDGLRSGGIWSDWSKPADRQRSLMPFSPAVSPQPIGPHGSFGQNIGMVCFLTSAYLSIMDILLKDLILFYCFFTDNLSDLWIYIFIYFFTFLWDPFLILNSRERENLDIIIGAS